jgi:CheY-like chemotaxis protein
VTERGGTTREASVLIVEDDGDIRATLRQLLTGEGFLVREAASAAAAIDLLERTRPAVALVDLLMPGIVGQELIEYLEGDACLAAIPVAVMSGSPELAPAGYRVFKKPLSLQPLVDFVRHHLPRQAPLREEPPAT